MPVYKKTSPAGKVSWYAIFYYKDWNGARKQKKKEGFTTQREAKAYERDFLERRAATPSMTFAALVDIYLEDYKSRRRVTSYNERQYQLNKHILPYFKNMPLNDITPAMVRSWQNELIASGDYAATYLKGLHAALSAVFNFAVKYYGLTQNPARLAGPVEKKKAPAMSFWTLEQFHKFQKAMDGAEPYHTVFTLMFYTGIRKGELLALTPGDFDFDNHTVSISKSYRRMNKVDYINPPKTEKGSRTISLPPFVSKMVKDFIASLYGIKHNQRIFESIGRYGLRYNLAKYGGRAGLPPIRVHDLRHSHASLLIEHGFSPIAIRDRLGHEDIQTTLNTYGHLYPNKQEEIASKLEELAAGSAAVEE